MSGTLPVAAPAIAGLERRSLANAGFWLAIAAISWATLAFGGVYPWGYWPLAAAALAAGAIGLAAAPLGARRGGASRPLAISLGILGAAVAVQLVPLRE